MGDEDCFRGVLSLLFGELVADEIGLDGATVRNVNAPCVDAIRLADRGEALAERAAAEDEGLIAGRQRVRDGGLETPRAGRAEEQYVVLGAEEILQRAGQGREQRGELRAAVVYQRSRRRGEHRLRNERGTRDAEVLRTVH